MSGGNFQPHSVEAERALLGSILINPQVLSEVQLEASAFFIVRHQWLYAAMLDLYLKDHTIDVVTLGALLEQRGQLKQIGGVSYLLELVRDTPSSLGARGYADIISQLAIRRGLIDAANRMVSLAHQSEAEVEDVLNQSADMLQYLNHQHAERLSELISIDEVASEVVVETIRRADDPCDVPGMRAGIDPLDIILGGFERGQLYYVAGRPGMGKSALLIQLARGLLDSGQRVLFFSLEMRAAAVARRMICQRAHVSYTASQRGRLTRDELDRFQHEARRLMDLRDRLLIEQRAGLGVRAMMSIARREEYVRGLDVVIIDTVNRVGDVALAHDQYHGMTNASHALADWAHNSSLAILAAAQLSRASQHAADKRPSLSDLRDSGAQEEDADVVLGLYRPHYYDQDVPEHLAEVLLLKHREGKSGARINLHFNADWPGFARLEDNRVEALA